MRKGEEDYRALQQESRKEATRRGGRAEKGIRMLEEKLREENQQKHFF